MNTSVMFVIIFACLGLSVAYTARSVMAIDEERHRITKATEDVIQIVRKHREFVQITDDDIAERCDRLSQAIDNIETISNGIRLTQEHVNTRIDVLADEVLDIQNRLTNPRDMVMRFDADDLK